MTYLSAEIVSGRVSERFMRPGEQWPSNMESTAEGDRTNERRRGVAVGTAVAVVLLLAVAGAGIATAGTVADGGATTTELDAASAATQADGPPIGEAYQQEIDPDSVRLTLSVEADGAAHWRIEYWTELNDANETEAFEQLQDDVAATPDEYAARFANRTNRTVASAENATGREMSAGEFGVSATKETIPREYGVLTYTFEWRGFAAVEGDRLRIGDAIEGFYLNDQTRLVVGWPDEYRLVSASPDADEQRDDAVLWRGARTDFVTGEPRVVVEDGGGSDDGGDGSPGGTDSGGSPLLWVGAALALFALAGGGLAFLRRNGDDDDDEAAAAAGGTAASSDPEPSDGTAAEAHDARSAAGRDPDAEDADVGAEDADGDAEDAADDGPPPELLSNEERVQQVLENNDGRMRQQELVDETGWTEAKTSQVVGEMRESGALESFRLGRENVLKLPDDDGEEDHI